MTMTTTDTPRIYAASLTDYNAGRLVGVWIDLGAADDIDEAHEAIREMLAEATAAHPEDGTREEWAVHDFENFHGLNVGEWCDLSQVWRWATMIDEHGPAAAAYIANDCGDLDDFEEAYAGEFTDRVDFASQLADDMGFEAPETWPASYIDWQSAAQDLFLGGDYWDAPAADGGIYVFRAI